MKKRLKRMIALFMAVFLVVSSVPVSLGANSVVAEAAGSSNREGVMSRLDYIEHTTGGEKSDNASKHNYGRWADTVKSYVEETEDGYLRTEVIDGDIILEEYSADYKLRSSSKLKMELPLFGGYFSGETYNFLVFGQVNLSEDDSAEIMRVVKYDKSWNRLESCSVNGANTYIPFDAGSLRMTESGGSLFIHTCHEMYASDDGYHHQANMTFVLDQNTMEVTQRWHDVMNTKYGYVSHSFNQFVKTDGTYLYRVDHGDAYPRAVVLTKAGVGSITSCISKDVFPISGNVGDNNTGVSVGGFEMAGGQLLVVGASVSQDDTNYNAYGYQNIFVTSTDTGLTSTNTTWLTDCGEGDGFWIANPHLVKVSENKLYVLWEEVQYVGGFTTVKVAEINANGELQGDIHTIYARLSDCAPIYTSEGEILWYTTEGDTPVFYHLSVNNLKEYEYTGKIDIKDCTIIIDPATVEYEGFYVYPPKPTVTYGLYTLQHHIDFEYSVSYPDNFPQGTATMTLRGLGLFEGAATRELKLVEKSSGNQGTSRPNPNNQSGGQGSNNSESGGNSSKVKKPGKVTGVKVKVKKKKLTVSWTKKSGVKGYQLQYALNKKFTKKKKSKPVKKTKITIKKLKQRKTYYFRVCAYKLNGRKKVYGTWSKVKKVKIKR